MLKTASIFLLIGLFFGTLYSAVLIVSPQTIAGSTYEARSHMKWGDIQDPAAVGTIIAETRHLGVFGLALNITLFFVLFIGFKKGQVWAWWTFLLVGTLCWGYGLVVQLIERDMLNLIGHLIGILLLALGLLLPIKVFFPKKPTPEAAS